MNSLLKMQHKIINSIYNEAASFSGNCIPNTNKFSRYDFMAFLLVKKRMRHISYLMPKTFLFLEKTRFYQRVVSSFFSKYPQRDSKLIVNSENFYDFMVKNKVIYVKKYPFLLDILKYEITVARIFYEKDQRDFDPGKFKNHRIYNRKLEVSSLFEPIYFNFDIKEVITENTSISFESKNFPEKFTFVLIFYDEKNKSIRCIEINKNQYALFKILKKNSGNFIFNKGNFLSSLLNEK